MLLQEPPRSDGDLNFVLFRVPVRIHPWFWVIMLLLGPLRGGPMPLVAWIIAVFLSILLHEFGHAAAMRSFGFYPSIVLYGMGGLTSWGPGAYGARNPGPAGRVLVSAAGPAAGFGFAAALYAILRLAGYEVAVEVGLPEVVAIRLQQLVVSEGLTVFIHYLFFVNVAWGVLNLLPIYPLDGGQIARELLEQASPAQGLRFSLMLSAFTAILIAIYAAVEWQSLWIAIFFGFLGFSSLQALAAWGRGPW